MRTIVSRRRSLALLGAGLSPALGSRSVTAQLLPPTPKPKHWPPAAATALTGRYIFTTGSAGKMRMDNVGSFLDIKPYSCVGLGVAFNKFPDQPAFFFSKEGVGLVVHGRKVGVVVYDGKTVFWEETPQDVFTGPGSGLPDQVYYVALDRKVLGFPPTFYWKIYVDGREVLSRESSIDSPRTGTGVYFGGFASGGFRGSLPTAAVDCNVNFYQTFRGPRAPDQQWLDARGAPNFDDDDRLSFYDLTKEKPVQVMDLQANGTFPRREVQYTYDGTARQLSRTLRGMDLVRMVAHVLAPRVLLHSKEQYFPCSVEWYLSRSRIVKTVLNSDTTIDPPNRFDRSVIPRWMSVVSEGPVDGTKLRAASTAEFSPSNQNDKVFLWPLEAKAGEQANWPGDHTSNRGTCLSTYQLETIAGWRPKDNECEAPCYCHIVANGGVYNITYYFLYAFNGGLGGVGWQPDPLAPGASSGWGAHFGDWEQATAKVAVFDDRSCELQSFVIEQHGDAIDTRQKFSRRHIDGVKSLKIYSAWHSHASYTNAGEQHRSLPAPNDFTDDKGATWQTAKSLVFLDDAIPDWARFNGDWGPRIIIAAGLIGKAEGKLVGGPEGPGFKNSWVSKP
jgi:Vacuolar protein sorting-associated protein 62